jgi:hypothetical protein
MSEEPKSAEDRNRGASAGEGEEPSGTGPEEAPAGASGPDGTARLPQIDFATFIFSLNSSALVHLGVLDDPASGEKSTDLPLAKQTIDILGMLQEKTRGNLTRDEEQMLKNILYDLRILYVKEKG